MTSATDLSSAIPVEEREAQVFVAPQWKLVWWKFRKHRVALVSSVILLLIYLIALLADFIAPFNTVKTDAQYLYAPPQGLHIEMVGGQPAGFRAGLHQQG